jgi:hypothetical protein
LIGTIDHVESEYSVNPRGCVDAAICRFADGCDLSGEGVKWTRIQPVDAWQAAFVYTGNGNDNNNNNGGGDGVSASAFAAAEGFGTMTPDMPTIYLKPDLTASATKFLTLNGEPLTAVTWVRGRTYLILVDTSSLPRVDTTTAAATATANIDIAAAATAATVAPATPRMRIHMYRGSGSDDVDDETFAMHASALPSDAGYEAWCACVPTGLRFTVPVR